MSLATAAAALTACWIILLLIDGGRLASVLSTNNNNNNFAVRMLNADVVEVHREDDSSHVTPILLSSSSSSSTMSENGHPICQHIPRTSVSYLWNEYNHHKHKKQQEQEQQQHGHRRSDSVPSASALFLRQGIRTRPRWTYWRDFMDLLLQERPIHIRMIVPSEEEEQEAFSWKKEWIQEAFEEAFQKWRNILHGGVGRDGKGDTTSSKINHSHIKLMIHHRRVDIDTTPLLWTDLRGDEDEPVDIILDAFSSSIRAGFHPPLSSAAVHSKTTTKSDMSSSRSTLMSPEDANFMRRRVQEWIRSVLLPREEGVPPPPPTTTTKTKGSSSTERNTNNAALNCTTTNKNNSRRKGRPLLMFLDPFWSSSSSSSSDLLKRGAWHGRASIRTIQELTDWYQLPFVSLTATATATASRTSTPSDKTTPQAIARQQRQRQEEEKDMEGTTSKATLRMALDLLFFALWDFTADFCLEAAAATTTVSKESSSSSSSTTTTTSDSASLLRPQVKYLAEHVVPPPLDLDLTLESISAKWRIEAAAQDGACNALYQQL